jgi:hypothetical protein
MNPLILRFKKVTALCLIVFALGCFGALPRAQAAVLESGSLAPGGSMHFIEQLFGSTPDGGNGLVELIIVALPFLLMSLAIKWTTAHSRH